MRYVYIAVSLISAIVIAAVIYGFNVVGSPHQRMAQKTDNTRISNMDSISYSIQNYFSQNQKLPTDLSATTATNIKDPETKADYEYKKLSDTNYMLCTTFATNSDDNKSKDDYDYYSYSDKYKHKKGFDCISYDVPSYFVQKVNPLPLPLPPPPPPVNPMSSVIAKVTEDLENISSKPVVFTTLKTNTILKEGTETIITYNSTNDNGFIYVIDEDNNPIGYIVTATSCGSDGKTTTCNITWNAKTVNTGLGQITIDPGKYYLVLTSVIFHGSILGKSNIFTVTK